MCNKQYSWEFNWSQCGQPGQVGIVGLVVVGGVVVVVGGVSVALSIYNLCEI